MGNEFRKGGQAKLPVQQLAILAACRFAEPIAATSIFPYLPEMIESFGIDKINVAKWAGMTSAVFSLAQCVTAVAWGRASDIFGRKPVILIGIIITMATSLLWGFSKTLPMAILARTLSGGGNGNVGIIRTMVAEMVQDDRELQPKAFTVMPLVWTIGSIIGPAAGGALSKPADNIPGLFKDSTFFRTFPFALPNIVAVIIITFGLITGLLFLKETLETRKDRPDWGLYFGRKLVSCFRGISRKPKKRMSNDDDDDDDDSGASLLRRESRSPSTSSFDNERRSVEHQTPLAPPTIREVLTWQSTINLVVYTLLALHTVASDQVLPIFMHHPKQIPDATNTRLPFKFSGGCDLESGRIGTLFTLYGICSGFVQFVIFPPMARKYGILNCFKFCSLMFPIVYFVTPYTALIQDSTVQQAALFVFMVLKAVAAIFAYPCSTILLTNSASSLRVLGTLNGVATSTSALGRAIGPALVGAAFTWGVQHGYMVVPFWFLTSCSAVGAVPVFFLQEMDGFSSTDESHVESKEEEIEMLATLQMQSSSTEPVEAPISLPNDAGDTDEVAEGSILPMLRLRTLNVP